MKYPTALAALCAALVLSPMLVRHAEAHPGGTDSSGCHTVMTTGPDRGPVGTRHCHIDSGGSLGADPGWDTILLVTGGVMACIWLIGLWRPSQTRFPESDPVYGRDFKPYLTYDTEAKEFFGGARYRIDF